MINEIISFIFGCLIKIIDDHYDMGFYDKKNIKFIEKITIILLIYWVNIDLEYSLGFLIISFICVIFNQIDNKQYLFCILIIAFSFIYKLKNANLNKLNYNLFDIIFFSFLIYIFICYEAKLFKEEYSERKLCFRIITLIFFICYYIFLRNIDKFVNISKISNILNYFVNKIFKKNNTFFKNASLILIGYHIVSIINIYKKLI